MKLNFYGYKLNDPLTKSNVHIASRLHVYSCFILYEYNYHTCCWTFFLYTPRGDFHHCTSCNIQHILALYVCMPSKAGIN